MKGMVKKLFSWTDGENLSSSFVDLALRQKHLTFDERFLNPRWDAKNRLPFKEIKWRFDRSYIKRPEYKGPYKQYVKELAAAFVKSMDNLDPNEQHLFIHSSGFDTRIISGAMLSLKRQGRNFDNVHFRLWGNSEKRSFLQIMELCGWRDYSIIDDSVEDPFDIGSGVCVEGWASYTSQLNFWKGFDPAKTVLISGAMGEVLSRTASKWYYGTTFFSNRGITLNRVANQFADVVFPMLDETVLDLAARMPPKWRNKPDKKTGQDKLRSDLVRHFGLHKIPRQRSLININLSQARKRSMAKRYYHSEFYKRYKKIVDLFPPKAAHGHGPKLWGFGVTVYDKVLR